MDWFSASAWASASAALHSHHVRSSVPGDWVVVVYPMAVLLRKESRHSAYTFFVRCSSHDSNERIRPSFREWTDKERARALF